MAELRCPGCGKQLAEHTRFCPDCGARLTGPGAEDAPRPPAAATPDPGSLRTVVLPPAPVAPSPAATPATPPARRALWWALGGVGCLGLLLVVACLTLSALTLLGQHASAPPVAPTTATGGGAGGVISADSPLVGGNTLVEDDFSSPATGNLDVSEDATSRSAYEDGTYVIEVKQPEQVVWSVVGGPFRNVSVQVEAAVAPDSDVAAAGLIFHYQDQDNFYLFSVSNDGYYTLELLEGGEWIALIDPTQSDKVGAVRNSLRVETRGERIALYANGALLEETTDSTFRSGLAALAVSTYADSAATVSFDNLQITRNDP